ncbi:unnamed protein product [Paramecium pentaurelia]|uniref:Uncharacterized protein n=1 Tax=Paramecium pentaurelia TaxID=43138 RepID=A0A8S1UK98_9CILI|nr:unnamed protein product [Paramecium pentaurelia]
MYNTVKSQENDTQILNSKKQEIYEPSIYDGTQEQNIENQQQLLNQYNISQQYQSIRQINSSIPSISGPANQKLQEQKLISEQYVSFGEQNEQSLQSQKEVAGNALQNYNANCHYKSIEKNFSDLSIIQNEQVIAPNLLQCQQAFCYILEQMINLQLQTPNISIKFDKEIEGYLQLKYQLQKDDLNKLIIQEKELLEFFQGWFSYDSEIDELQTKSNSNGNIQYHLNLNFQTQYDFENECLKNFKKFILNKKQNELDKLKEYYQESNTLNNWKKIMDDLKVNNIQVFIMLCLIKDKEPQNKFAHYYIQWWFDWNQTSVFIKTKEKYQ